MNYIENFPGLRSFILGFAVYKGVNLFSTHFKDAINPSYAAHKVHYDAAISFACAALTGSSISVNLFYLANHYINTHHFFSDETKKKYHLQYAVPAIGFLAANVHVQEMNLASKLLFKNVIGPVVGFGYSNVAKPTVSVAYNYMLAPVGKAAFAATKYCLSTAYSAAFKTTGYIGSNYVLPVFYAKCTTILSAPTIGALGYIGLYFVAPLYLINSAANQQTTISNWSLDMKCIVVASKQDLTPVETELVTKYKELRKEVNSSDTSIYSWLNSSSLDEDGYKKYTSLVNFIEKKSASNELDMNRLDVKEQVDGQEVEKYNDNINNFLSTINTYSTNAGYACTAYGAAGLVALFAPSAFVAPLVLAAACILPVANHYANHVNARYNGEIQKLLNPVAPVRS